MRIPSHCKSLQDVSVMVRDGLPEMIVVIQLTPVRNFRYFILCYYLELIAINILLINIISYNKTSIYATIYSSA